MNFELGTPPRPRLCFVGPMLGGNPGWVTSQGEILAALFAREGYQVRLTSCYPGRAPRLADTVGSLIVWSRQVDVVIVMVFSGLGFVAADVASWLARRLRKPLVLALHGGYLPTFARKHPRWVKGVLGRAQAVVAQSGYLQGPVNQLGFDVRIIPNVIELERYSYQERRAPKPEVLWMRTFHDNYQPERAIDVLQHVLRFNPDVRLTMAGQDKGTLAAVKRLVSVRGLCGQVRFPGFLDDDGKGREFARHDIFLNTSRLDNTPVSMLEAAAFGLPIVSTRVGGIPFLFQHDQTALLVEDRDTDAMAKAVGRLLGEPGLAARLSRAGRELAEHCGWPPVRARWEALFSELPGRA